MDIITAARCRSVVALALLGLLATPASAQLVADFSLSPASGPADLTVQFSDQSGGGPIQWIWTFGDGCQAAGASSEITHVYTEPGTYDVSLKVIGPGLQTDSVTKVGAVVVEPAILVPAFEVSFTEGALGDQVLATSMTTGSTQLETTSWDFGDGTPIESGTNVLHKYELPGSFSVSLTVSGGGTTETLTKTDLISIDTADLQVAFTPSTPVSGELPLEVAFSYSGEGVRPHSYLWDFGDAAPPSNKASPELVVGELGFHDVSLTVSYYGLEETLLIEDLLEVVAVPFAVDAGITTPLAGPAPHPATFEATATVGPEATAYAWDFGDGTLAEGPEASVSHVYTEPGQYAVSLRASYFGQEHETEVPELVHVGPYDAWQLVEIGPPAGVLSSSPRNVALDGDRLAVRDREGDIARVRVFDRDAAGDWSLSATLFPDLGTAGVGSYGSLALDGDTLLVGDTQQQRPGRANVFERRPNGTWLESAILQAPGEDVFRFGYSVDLQAGRALVGSSSVKSSHQGPDRACVFDRQPDGSWSHVISFIEPDGLGYFAGDVALSGDRVMIGSSSQVTTFQQLADGSWVEAPALLPEPGLSGSFGYQLAAHGDRLAVLGSVPDTPWVGSYTWSQGSWRLDQGLEPGDAPSGASDPSHQSGPSVTDMAMTATRLVLSHGGAVSGHGLLRVHTLQDDGQWDAGRLVASQDGEPGDGLGGAVAADGDEVLAVAAGHDHHPGNASGALYLFQRVAQADLGLGGPAGPRLALAGGDLTLPGAPATLSLTGGLPRSAVVLVVGMSSFDPPLFAQGGLLLPMPDLLLTGLTTSAAGAAFLPLKGGAGAPVELFVQAVVAGPHGSQFSNALGVTLGL